MKKILTVFICVLLLCGCQQKHVTKLEIQGIKPIGYHELQEYLDSSVSFVLYIGRDDCRDCQEFRPILEKYINEHDHNGVYYLDLKEYRNRANQTDVSEDEKAFYNHLNERFKLKWIPTVHKITNGQIVKTYEYLNEDYYKIKEKDKQIRKKKEFIDKFYKFMDEVYKEE